MHGFILKTDGIPYYVFGGFIMTFSEKLKEARKNAGLSQEQLAEKLCVSRQAVTKWETGKGMPDIENIKAVSGLLNVSIDYLLSDESEAALGEIREKIDLESYSPSNGAKTKRDACVAEKFPDADHIYVLSPQKKKWLLQKMPLPWLWTFSQKKSQKRQNIELISETLPSAMDRSSQQ